MRSSLICVTFAENVSADRYAWPSSPVGLTGLRTETLLAKRHMGSGPLAPCYIRAIPLNGLRISTEGCPLLRCNKCVTLLANFSTQMRSSSAPIVTPPHLHFIPPNQGVTDPLRG